VVLCLENEELFAPFVLAADEEGPFREEGGVKGRGGQVVCTELFAPHAAVPKESAGSFYVVFGMGDEATEPKGVGFYSGYVTGVKEGGGGGRRARQECVTDHTHFFQGDCLNFFHLGVFGCCVKASLVMVVVVWRVQRVQREAVWPVGCLSGRT